MRKQTRTKHTKRHNRKTSSKKRRGGADTPLFYAAQNGEFEKVKSLVEEEQKTKSDFNVDDTINYDGMTPLYAAARYGHLDIVKFLVEHGADKDRVNTKDGQTPLLVSIMNNKLPIVKYLVEQGADIEKSYSYGWTPLIVASMFGRMEILQLLIEHGADKNKPAKNGDTPLQFALDNNKLEVAKYLIEQSATIYPKNREGIHGEYVKKLEDIQKEAQITALDKKNTLYNNEDVRKMIKSYIGGRKTRKLYRTS